MSDEPSTDAVRTVKSLKTTLSSLMPSAGTWRQAIISMAMFAMMAGSASAQSVEGADQALCESGLGQVIGIVLMLLTIGLGIFAAFRGAIGLMNMGSSRSEKVQQGRSQVRGAGLAVLGALFPAAISFILESLGVPTLSCVDLNILNMVAPLMI